MSDQEPPRLVWADGTGDEARAFTDAIMNELAVADTSRTGFGRTLDYNPSALVTRKGLRIFDEMRIDDQVKAAVTFKKLSVFAPGWEIISPDGEKDDWEPTRFARAQLAEDDGAFDEDMFQIMNALEYGYSVSELVWNVLETGPFAGKIGLKAIRSKRPHDFDFRTDKFGALLPDGLVQRYTERGDVSLPVDKFVIWTHQFEYGNYYGRSDLEAAYRAWWLKRNSYQWLAMLLERFGIPPIFALYSPSGLSKQQVADLLTVIRRLQAATSGAIPRRDKDALELWSPELADNVAEVFIPALSMINQDISRAILMPELIGMTGGSGERGSFARSKTQFDAFTMVVKYLQRQMAGAVVNRQIIRRMIDYNYDTGGRYPEMRFLPMADDLKIKMLTVWNQLLQTGGVAPDPVDEAHVRRTFGMPARSTPQPALVINPSGPGGTPPGDDVADDDDEPAGDGDTAEAMQEDVEDHEQVHDHARARRPNKYEKRVDFAAIARDLDTINNNAITTMVPLMRDVQERFLKAVRANFDGDVEFIARITELRGIPKLRQAVGQYLEALFDGGRASVRGELESVVALAAEPSFRPTDAIRWLKAKKFWITGIINDRITQEARGVLLRAVETGEPLRETMKTLGDLFIPYVGDPGVVRDGRVVTPWRLETIVRTNATDAFNLGRLVEARRAGDLVQAFEYSAILDARTTPVCMALDGKVFKRDDPNLQKLRPPRHYNCLLDGQTVVYTVKGWRPIAKIEHGELVLTHKGRFKPVTCVHHVENPLTYRGTATRLHFKFEKRRDRNGAVQHRDMAFLFTPDHPILTRDRGWVAAAKLTSADVVSWLASVCEECGSSFPWAKHPETSMSAPQPRYCSTSCLMKANAQTMWCQPGHREHISATARAQMHAEYKSGARDKTTIAQKANERTREIYAMPGEGVLRRADTHAKAAVARITSPKWQKAVTEDRRGDKNPLRVHPEAGRRAGQKTQQFFRENPHRHPNRMMGRAVMKGHEGYLSKGQRALYAVAGEHVDAPVELEYPVRVNDGRAFYVDVAVPSTRIGFEYDGSYWHKDEAKDAARDVALAEVGWSIIRYRDRVPAADELRADYARLCANHDGEYSFTWVPVARVEHVPLKRGKRRYNLAVLDDESYVTKGLIVHNCRSVLVPLTNDIVVSADDMATADDVAEGMKLSGTAFGGAARSREIPPRN